MKRRLAWTLACGTQEIGSYTPPISASPDAGGSDAGFGGGVWASGSALRPPFGQPFVFVIGANEYPDYYDPIELF